MGLAKKLQRNRQKLAGGYSIRDYVPPRFGPYGLELHSPFANFEGPKTDIVRRIREGIKPTTHTDAAAKIHDQAYFNTSQQLKKGIITKAQAYNKIKAADNALMRSAAINKISINPIEHMHANLALAGMAGKKGLQAIGAMPELAFVSDSGPPADEIEGGKRRRKKQDPVSGLKKRLKKLGK